jgi:hypothetical protein
MQTDPMNISVAHRHMNIGIGTEAGRFLLWEHKLDFLYNNLDELLVPFLHMVTILTSYRTSFVTIKTNVHPDSNIKTLAMPKVRF